MHNTLKSIISISNDTASRSRLTLQICFAFLLAACISALVIGLSEQRRIEADRASVHRIVDHHMRLLDQSINQALSATYALAALVRQGRGTVDDFEATAGQMLQLYPGVAALQLAPNGIVSDSVPLKGNEKAIGHNLLQDPQRTREAFLARETGKLTLAGPFSLIQGGTAVVGRLPVFLNEEQSGSRFWGFTSVMMRFPESLEAAGLSELQLGGYSYQLWRVHPDSGEIQIIAATTTAPEDPVIQKLTVPNGEWLLSVAPAGGWNDPAGFARKLALATLFCLLFTFAAGTILRQPAILRAEVDKRTRELKAREELLTSMNELSSDWYWTTDTDYRFTSLTSGIERIIRIRPDDLLGKHRWDMKTTLTDAEWTEHRKTLDGRQSFRDFQYGVHQPDGTINYISISGQPVFDEAGNFTGYRGTGRNVTERKRIEQHLIDSEARFQALFEQAPVALSVTMDTDGFVSTRWNATWLKTFGYPAELAQWKSGNELGLWVNPEDRDRYIHDATQLEQSGSREVRMRHANGDIRLVSVSGSTILSGKNRMLLTCYDDITDRRLAETHLRESLQRLELHVSGTPLAVIDWDSESRVVAWNPAAERIFGYSQEEALGKHASFIVPEQYRYRVDGVMKALFGKAGGHRSTNPNVTKSGASIECEWYNAPIADESGQVVALSSLVHDVTDRVHYMAALEHQAHHDPLTQLYNRNWLATEIDRKIHETPELPFHVLFVDLDRFKEINDTLGHQIGDELLIKLADRLKQEMDKRECVVARLGGDEFAVLAPDTPIELLAQDILLLLRQPVALSGMNLEVGAGVGVASYPTHGDDAASLMRCADIAMYHAKSMARGYTVFTQAIDTYSQDQLVLMNELRSAIRNDELQLYFQPKIGIANTQLIGYEALLRWCHPERGLVPPNHFIPHAEFTDLMQPITLWVIEGAMHQWLAWVEEGHRASIAINLSSRNLLEDKLPDNVGLLLGTYGVDPSCIEFEITESAVMADPEKALDILVRLRALGVSLSIDDFGTGYSSLAYLRKLPVQKLKIDATFVMGMHDNREDRIIVESTIGLAHNLGLKVVAEGVETEASLALLAELGCDEAQGYYFSRPQPPEILKQWRQSWAEQHTDSNL
jgi:diguanylate cyclase (GGDEF)-like protein/PAS domain S-box-containing protein